MGKQVKNEGVRKVGRKMSETPPPLSGGSALSSGDSPTPHTPHSSSPSFQETRGTPPPLPAFTPPLAWPSFPRSQLVPNPPALSRAKGQQRTFSRGLLRDPAAETSAKVERPEKLEEASQCCYLLGTLETETAATAAALLPRNACLSATDIETAAILLQANTRTDHRKGQTSFVFKPIEPQCNGVGFLG